METAGVTRRNQRLAAPYAEDSMRCLEIFRECFPAVYEKALYRVPGVTVAARYANTQLYSFGSAPAKPEGITWNAHIAQLIEHYSEDQRPRAAHSVACRITSHCNKTVDPILPFAGHPDDGMSWEQLSVIAARGDFKERRQANLTRDPEILARRQAAYDEERAALEAVAGRRLVGTEAGDIVT